MSSLPLANDSVQLSPEEYAARRRLMEVDPWYFYLYATPFGAKAVERIDRPLLYICTRRAALLVATLDDPRFAGEVTDQVKADLRACGIDWTKPEELPRVQERLRRVNIRMPRGTGKSTVADGADVWDATDDPNMTISLGTKADKYAQKRITSMGEIVTSAQYAFWFPDRVPRDLKHDVTQDAIFIGGRTVIKPEATIEGRGIQSPWTGSHYRKNRRDDIVGTESGDASTEDARKHMAQMTSLRDNTAWEGEIFIGTINGEEDDNSILMDDDGVMHIIIPIERHRRKHFLGEDCDDPEAIVETDTENLWVAGDPTMPDKAGFNREGVAAIKTEQRVNPNGLTWLLQNYFMIAHKGAGGVIFPKRLLDRSEFQWFYDSRLKRELIGRPKLGREDTERDRTSSAFRPEDWFLLDPKKVPRSARAWAADQSTNEDGTGDEWALSYVLMDHEGAFYLIHCIAGYGYDEMVDSFLPFDKLANWPPRNGIDANATQRMTIDWLKRDAANSGKFRDLAARVVPIKSNGEAKDTQIRNWIQSRMKQGTFYFNPRLKDWRGEAYRYRPRRPDGRKNKKAIDNRLDSTWMAMTLPVRPASPEEIEQQEALYSFNDRAAAQHEAPGTHMDNRSWMSQMTGWKVA